MAPWRPPESGGRPHFPPLFDPVTNEVIPKGDERVGEWRAFMVTFPLRKPVQEFEAATVAFPTETSAFDHLVTDDERDLRALEMAKRRRGRALAITAG